MKKIIRFVLLFYIFSLCGCKNSDNPSNNSITHSENNNTQIISTEKENDNTLKSMQLIHTNDQCDFMEILPYTQTGTGLDRDLYEIPMYYYYAEGIESISDENTRNMISIYIEQAKEKMRTIAEIYSFKYNNIRFIENVKCINGYCMINICCDLLSDPQSDTDRQFGDPKSDKCIRNFMCDIAYFDLISNEQLSISDLFYKDENFIDIFNDAVVKLFFNNIFDKNPYGRTTEDSKNVFEGITEGCVYIDITTGEVILPYFNPYFTNSKTFNADKYKLCYNSIIWQPRDMKEKVSNQTMRLFENQDFFHIIDKKEIASCIADPEKIKRLNEKCREIFNEKKDFLKEIQTLDGIYDDPSDKYILDVDFYNKVIVIKTYINEIDSYMFYIDYETEEELTASEAAKKFSSTKHINSESTYDKNDECFDDSIDLITDEDPDNTDITDSLYKKLDKNNIFVFLKEDKTGIIVHNAYINDALHRKISVCTEDYSEDKY